MIRAFQWDLARQVERLDWMLAQLPRYAEWGYQELYLHLEDALDYPSFPGIARRDAYRLRDLEHLTVVAGRCGIRVVPIVNLLGHTQYLIKVPELRDLNELRRADGGPEERGQVCPLHPRMLEVAQALFRDVAPLCSAGRVHAGLDESFLLGQHPLSREEIARIGLAGHFAAHVGRLHTLASGLGLKLGLWADMLALLPDAIPLLPPGLAAYDWYYYPFGRNPRLELRNFAEYDIEPALRARGIDYWGCPMNGAFRYEPMPVFTERLANLRSWWQRAKHRGAAGFLVCSWESYRLAQEMTTLVDAAAASLWLDPGVEDQVEMLARGFARVFGPAHCHRLARQALACDERAFSGYARWEINERWDAGDPREGYRRYAAEQRFFERLARREDLPEPFSASVAFRHYLAQRDVFVRRSQRELLQLRRLLARLGGEGFGPVTWKELPEAARHIGHLREEARIFAGQLKLGSKAARRMWLRTRDPKRRGQNEELMDGDGRRLRCWRQWLSSLVRRPSMLWGDAPLVGAWQLQFVVYNIAPALQRIVVEQRSRDGSWRELCGRYTIEFRAVAARPHAKVRRPFSLPVSKAAVRSRTPLLRIAVRGLGQVLLGQVVLGNGVRTLHALGHQAHARLLIGEPARQEGFPEMDMSVNRGAVELVFADSKA